MAIALVSNTIIAGGPTGGTTPSINTTGATLLVANLGYYASVAAATVSDSKGNTWNYTTLLTDGITGIRLAYAVNPTVGSGHTFSWTAGGPSVYGCLTVAAFSGVKTTSPFDLLSAGTFTGSGGFTVAPGSLTASVGNELFVTGFHGNVFPPTTPCTIDNSFTITDTADQGASDHFAGALAYKIVTSGSVNPNWLLGQSGGRIAATMATFLPDSGVADVTVTVSDTIALSDALATSAPIGSEFIDSISLSDAVSINAIGDITVLALDDILAFADSAVANFAIKTPPSLRGNIDYDQIKASARSGDGSKLITLKGSFVPGNTVVFDADGNLIDAGHT